MARDNRSRVFRYTIIAILAGLILLVSSSLAGRDFPYTITPPDDSFACPHPGCTVPYNPYFIAMDYLFWMGIAFVTVFALDVALARFARGLKKGFKGSSARSLSMLPTATLLPSTTNPAA